MGRLSSIYFTHIHTVTSVLGTMARRMRRPTCTGASVTSTDSLIRKISTRRGLRARLLLVLVQLPYYQYRRYAYAAKVATVLARSRSSTAVPVPVHVQCAYLEY